MLVVLAGPVCGELTGSYSVVVDGNGTAVVTLVVTGLGTVNVPLPLDVKTPAVRDALYVKVKNGVDVSVDAGGQSTIVYRTSLLTFTNGGSTLFRMELPKFDSANVVLYVPEYAEVLETDPNAAISHVGLSKSIVWTVKPSQYPSVEAEYAVQKGVERPVDDSMLYAVLAVVAALFVTVSASYLILRKSWGG